jgi:hypothetical protein
MFPRGFWRRRKPSFILLLEILNFHFFVTGMVVVDGKSGILEEIDIVVIQEKSSKCLPSFWWVFLQGRWEIRWRNSFLELLETHSICLEVF